MLVEAKLRTQNLQAKMEERGIQKAVFTDESSMAYLVGFLGVRQGLVRYFLLLELARQFRSPCISS